jgi:NADP-dependent 3-hydroxy acid dehydrogenase YdfG
VWVSTSLLNGARPFHSVYASTKMASKFAIDLIRQEATHIQITEVNVGPTKTNFRHRNLEGTRNQADINMEYDSIQALDPRHVAEQIVQAWQHKRDILTI